MAVLSPCTDITALIDRIAGIRIVGKAVKVHGVLEHHSNCPWCGGEDRFITRPGEGTYSCSIRVSGCGRYGDMISFLREYCDMTFWEACEEIGIDPSELGDYTQSHSSAQAYGSPSKQWQERGERMVSKAQSLLHLAAGNEGLEYLRARGLIDGTLLDKGLGYVPFGPDGRWHSSALEEWGLTAEDTGKERVWQPEGILIPWYVGRKLWKIDIRRLNGLKQDDPKILCLTGSVDCLYNHDLVTASKPVVLVESALCAITGEQEAGDLVTFVATGGAGKQRPSWAKHLDQAPFVLVALDNDDPDERGIRAGDEGAAWWEKNLARSIRWLPWKKDVNDMLRAGIDIREWVQDGIDFYKALEEAKSAPVWEEPITEPIPVVADPVPEQVIIEPMSEDDLVLDGFTPCYSCLDLDREIPGSYEHDGIMYCVEHYPPVQSISALVARVQEDLPAFRGSEIQYWRAEDSKRMRESVLRKYQAEEMQKPRQPYAPISLPTLPRSACSCVTLGWNKDGSQTKHPCRGKATENGFCEEHRLSYEFLEIGAQLGYPLVQVPFKARISKRSQTLQRTIYAGVTCWEEHATTLLADRQNSLKVSCEYLQYKVKKVEVNM